VRVMTEIGFLGTGGSVATPERDNTSLVISHGEELVLIDCPGSILAKIKKLGFSPDRLDSILVTHVHPDHIYGLPALIHSLMLEDGTIRLYGSEETASFCAGLLDLFGLRRAKIRKRVKIVPLKPGESFELARKMDVRCFRVPHSEESLAYRLTFDDHGKSLLYSGDTPPHGPLFQEASGLDYLIHDASAPRRYFEEYPSLVPLHTSSQDLGLLAERAGVGCLLPCHFFGELEYTFAEIEREIRLNYTGRLIIPHDFDKMKL
jgi:ribonuclease Z